MQNNHQLIEDLREMIQKKPEWNLTDLFALGYLAGKYGLEKFKDNEEELIEACRKYDRMDDLGLADTISTVLVDSGVINEIKTDDENNISETTQS